MLQGKSERATRKAETSCASIEVSEEGGEGTRRNCEQEQVSDLIV